MKEEGSAPSPLGLLIRINLTQGWRRLTSVREQSMLLIAVICCFVAGYALFSFWLFYKAFRFIDSFPGLGGLLAERLLYLLFAFLMVLLLFSNLVIAYTNLFRNRETFFLLSLPVSTTAILQWKLIESALLASWAFLFLIAPLLAAYGLTHQLPWHFYAVTFGLVGLFTVLPAVFGACCAVVLARFMDRRIFQIVTIGAAVVALVSAGFWFRPEPITDTMLETRVLTVLDRLLAKTRFSQFPFLPSYWLSAGVLNWAEGAVKASAFFALVLSSHVLFFGYLGMSFLGPGFYDGVSRVQSRSSVLGQWAWFNARQKRRRAFTYPKGWVERLVAVLVPRPDVKALLAKDIRVFWRDTAQWGQSLVLFGLLGVYIINLRHFSHQLTHPFWIDIVSYLNLAACSLNLATLTTRFVYPQFSLEGKRLWIVGMAPLGLRQVVKIKFVLASVASMAVTTTLILLSCKMLGLGWDRMVYFVVAIAVMTATLNGLAIGLGVLYPNFKEENPSKIVSGFGGTFCLVLSFGYIVASIAALAVGAPWSRGGEQDPRVMLGCWAAFVVLSVTLGWGPYSLAARRLKQFEM